MVPHSLTVYGRLECHLCQDMLTALKPYQAELGFNVDFIDIDHDQQMVEKYGERVPVLVGEKQEICQYFLDKQALFQYFERG